MKDCDDPKSNGAEHCSTSMEFAQDSTGPWTLPLERLWWETIVFLINVRQHLINCSTKSIHNWNYSLTNFFVVARHGTFWRSDIVSHWRGSELRWLRIDASGGDTRQLTALVPKSPRPPRSQLRHLHEWKDGLQTSRRALLRGGESGRGEKSSHSRREIDRCCTFHCSWRIQRPISTC